MEGDEIATRSLITWHLVWDMLLQLHVDREMATTAVPSVPVIATASAADSPAAVIPTSLFLPLRMLLLRRVLFC